MARKPSAVARELLRNFPRSGGKRRRRRRSKEGSRENGGPEKNGGTEGDTGAEPSGEVKATDN
jgi:hypothetical protein